MRSRLLSLFCSVLLHSFVCLFASLESGECLSIALLHGLSFFCFFFSPVTSKFCQCVASYRVLPFSIAVPAAAKAFDHVESRVLSSARSSSCPNVLPWMIWPEAVFCRCIWGSFCCILLESRTLLRPIQSIRALARNFARQRSAAVPLAYMLNWASII